MDKLRLEEVKSINGRARISTRTTATPKSVPLASTLSNADVYLMSSCMLPGTRCSLAPEVPIALLGSLFLRVFDFQSVSTQDASGNTRITRLIAAGSWLMLCSQAGTLGWCSVKGRPVEMAFHIMQWGLKWVCCEQHGLAPLKGGPEG